jgi:hypothetical protein
MAWLNAIGSALSAIARLAGLIFAYSAGRNRARAQDAAKAAKQAREGHEIEEDVARLGDDDLDRELRGR